jgi:flagellar basal body-associated protein FliL
MDAKSDCSATMAWGLMGNLMLKFEEFFNLVWEKLITLLKTTVKSILPQRLKSIYGDGKKKVHDTKSLAREKAQEKKTYVIEKVEKLKELDYKTKLEHHKKLTTEKGKKLVEDAKGLNRKKISTFILGFILWPQKKFQSFVASLTPTQSVIATVMSALTTLGTLAIYNSGDSFYERVNKNRKPAAIAKPDIAAAKRTKYYNTIKKSIKISSIRVPVYSLKPTDMSVLIVDITIKANTQFLTKFIKAKEHIFRDTLLSKMEPITASFTLQPEGKRIIKEVVTRELNSFLENKSYKGEPVQGKVVDVYIDYIMGS